MSGITRRYDPYKNFKFKVYFGEETEPIGGVSKVSMLKRTTEVIEHRDGGDASTVVKAPGQTKYEPITLERGVFNNQTFENWAMKIHSLTTGAAADVSIADFRKDIRIEMLDEAGNKAMEYTVWNCWISEYQALPELDASGNAVAIESITIQHQGWERTSEAAAETAAASS